MPTRSGRWADGLPGQPVVEVCEPAADTPVTFFDQDTDREELTALDNVRTVEVVEAVRAVNKPVLLSATSNGAESVDIADGVLRGGASPPGPLMTFYILLTVAIAALFVVIMVVLILGQDGSMTQGRRYKYIGPAELGRTPVAGNIVCVRTAVDLDRWLISQSRNDLVEPFTFVVDLDGWLWLASRRSEHVGLAHGRDVLGAGEIQFGRSSGGWVVDEVSNQSTGYCPDPDSWPAVASALDRADVPYPEDFTNPVIFRRCPACAARNLVRDDVYVCAVCDGDLPADWNFDTP